MDTWLFATRLKNIGIVTYVTSDIMSVQILHIILVKTVT